MHLELSKEAADTFEYIYTLWPLTGVSRVLDFVLPKEYRLALLGSELENETLRELIELWERQDLPANPPFRALSTPFNPEFAGILCYPAKGSFAIHARPGEVSLEYVQLAVTEIIIAGLIIFLVDIIPKKSGSMELPDIYRALRDPEGLEDATYAAKWLYACYREAVILPRFGTVERFMESIMRLKKKSRGYWQLLVDSQFSNAMVKAILPKDDIGLNHLVDMLFICDTDDTCPKFYYQYFMWEYFEYPHTLSWTTGDMKFADELLGDYNSKE